MQQKQIIVTCNYEARRRGLHKLQLINDAKRTCPDVVIVLGEDLTRFRDASKELYSFLRAFSWNSRVERLGFDEVFMDVSDIIDYNAALLNHDFANSFFCLSKNDPTLGFHFNAAVVAGHTYPEIFQQDDDSSREHHLQLRLTLASHLANHLRHLLEKEKGYTCTVGISTNKLLSKLVGNIHKPNDQTTLLPPYDASNTHGTDNVTSFMDSHELGKVPGIGFKLAQQLRAYVLGRDPQFDRGLVYGGTKEHVSVADLRKYAGMGADTLERILAGPGTPHGIGTRIWGLLNGCDNAEVGPAREVPKQISIEDSYLRLDNLGQVLKELRMLASGLLTRMHTDLLEYDSLGDHVDSMAPTSAATTISGKRWLALPRTIRLSTRPRAPKNPDGSRSRSFARISRSAPMPNFVFSLTENVDALSSRLVSEVLVPLFRKIHHEKSGWDLSLINIAVTNMVDAASDTNRGAIGRNIATMFRNQDDVLKQWKVDDESEMQGELAQGRPSLEQDQAISRGLSSIDMNHEDTQATVTDEWQSDEDDLANDDMFHCEQCDAVLPTFAAEAHRRWHVQD